MGVADGGDRPDADVPAPAPTASRSCARSGTATEIDEVLGALPHQGRARRRPTRRPQPWRIPSPSTTNEPRGSATWAASPQALCGSCGRDTTTSRPTTTTGTGSTYICRVCGFTGGTDSRRRTAASWWKVDWPMRWAWSGSTSSRPVLDHMPPDRRYTVGLESFLDLRLARRARRPTPSSGSRGAEDVSSTGASPPPRRAGRPGGADAALALRPPRAKQAFDIDFGPRCPAVRRVGRLAPQGRRPGEARRRGAGSSGLPTCPPVRCRSRRSPSPSGALLDRRRDRGSAELISRIVGTSGSRTPPSTTWSRGWLRRCMDGVAARRGPDRGPLEPDAARLAALTEGEAIWLRSSAAGSWRAGARRGDHAGLRRPQAGARPRFDDAPTDQVKADQKDFFGLLYHLLVGAERGPRLPTLSWRWARTGSGPPRRRSRRPRRRTLGWRHEPR